RDSRITLPPEDVAARRRHILWLIEHHSESEILGTWCSRLSPLQSGHLSDPDGYTEAKALWLAQTTASATKPKGLANAADFLEVADKALSEKLLLRAQSLHPDVKWSVRLARLYALALMGAVDAITSSSIDERQPVGIAIYATSESEGKSSFADSVRKT